MKKYWHFLLLILFFISAAFSVTVKTLCLSAIVPGSIDTINENGIWTSIGNLRVPFIKNEWQIRNRMVKYYANSLVGTIFITNNQIIYVLRGGSNESAYGGSKERVGAKPRVCPMPIVKNKGQGEKSENKEDIEGWVIKEIFINAKQTKAEGIKEAVTKVSYFKSNDPNNWKSNVHTYQEISLGELYDHIQLNLKAYGKNIEKLFVVDKGGRLEDIAIKIEGAEELTVNKKGELEIKTGIGAVKMTQPVAYQEIEGKRVDVTVAYAIQRSAISAQPSAYGFKAGNYNHDYPLIIDPLLESTFVGGSDRDEAYTIATDSSGNVFVAGYTYSSDYPATQGAYDISHSHCDGFILKLNNSLTTLLASTFIGGSKEDEVSALVIDQSGNVFVTGMTRSADFPTMPEAYNRSYEGGYHDGFVSKLNNSLTTLLASTFIGGNAMDEAHTLAIDQSGNVFIGGETRSTNFPITSGIYDSSYHGDHDGFVSKLNNSLTTLLASTFIGGRAADEIYTLAIDQSGNVLIGGRTWSTDFPTTSGTYDPYHNGGGWDGFVSKLNNSLTTLLASTFIGGSNQDHISALAIDSSGNVFVVGHTLSSDFPTTPGAYNRSYNGGDYDGFVSKLNNSLTSLLASTFIGGNKEDGASALAIDLSGNVYVTGYTRSSDFPKTLEAYDQSYNRGGWDGFVSKLNNSLASLLASTFIGGSDKDETNALAIDPSLNVFVAGYTCSSDFPNTQEGYDKSYNGSRDVFVAKLDNNLAGPSVESDRQAMPEKQPKWPFEKKGRFLALLIGINRYQDSTIPTLNTAIKDVRGLEKILFERYGFEKITLLLDSQATKKTIDEAFRQIIKEGSPDDSILIYFAGHGDLDKITGDGWWIPFDARTNDPSSYLDNVIIHKYIRAMKARHILLVSDSCYSGTLLGEYRALPAVIEDKFYRELYEKKSRWGITSGNKTPVSDSGSEGHSIFAYYFTKFLQENQKPCSTPREIYSKIGPIVRNNSEQMPLCLPIRNTGDEGGEFVFILK